MIFARSIIFLLFISQPITLFCQRDYYIPKSLFLPLHDQPQQIQVSLGYGAGIDLNFSFTFYDHFAVFTTGIINQGAKTRKYALLDSYEITKDDYAFTGGIGYFKKFDFTILETYLGGGVYNINNHWNFTSNKESIEYTEANYLNLFYQINFGKRNEEGLFGIALRVSYSNYKDFIFYDSYIEDERNYVEGLNIFTIDPSLFWGIDFKFFYLNLQGGLTVPFKSNAKVFTKTNLSTTKDDFVFSEMSLFGKISLQYFFYW